VTSNGGSTPELSGEYVSLTNYAMRLLSSRTEYAMFWSPSPKCVSRMTIYSKLWFCLQQDRNAVVGSAITPLESNLGIVVFGHRNGKSKGHRSCRKHIWSFMRFRRMIFDAFQQHRCHSKPCQPGERNAAAERQKIHCRHKYRSFFSKAASHVRKIT